MYAGKQQRWVAQTPSLAAVQLDQFWQSNLLQQAPFILWDFGLAEAKLDNCERNVTKFWQSIQNDAPRFHCETRPPMTSMEFKATF